MSYDPRQNGALCDRCVLSGCKPVPPEPSRSRPFAVLVGEAPGEKEVDEGRPFIGPSGFELQRGMQTVGLRRAECHITNAALCLRGKGRGNIERAEREAKKRNETAREKAADRGITISDADFDANKWLDPVEACRPRLMREIAQANPSGGVITLGGVAYRAVTSRRERILEVRGGPKNESFGRLLPTLHPSFVMQTRRWTRAFASDLGRAKRWFTTGLAWKDPDTIYLPTPTDLTRWLEREAGKLVVYDVETAPGFPEADRYDAQYDRLRCIGLASGDGQRATIVRFRSKEDPTRLYYSMDDLREFVRIFTNFFASPRWTKAGHNAGYYDRMVAESHFKVTPAPLIDTIGLHKFVEPELPHALGYVGSVYTDVDSWKQGHHANENETDREEEIYCVKDCAVTALSIAPLAHAIKDRNQVEQARFWPFLQEQCVELHKNGMLVDQAKRREWDEKLLKMAREQLKVIRDAVGRNEFNPGSTKQVGALLFDAWDLMPVGYTDLGDPSTGDDALREILAKQDLKPGQRAAIESIRLYRRRVKYRGTYTLKLRPMNESAKDEYFSIDDEETWEEREKRFKKETKKLGIVLADGRVHSDWNAHGTLGWRLSSSNMNMQNYPVKLRDMIIAPPGRKLVACDQAQLELRVGAGLAKSVVYLEAFAQDQDPHLQFCYDIFGTTVYEAAKDKKALRRLVKELTYASEYRAEVETVHSVLTSSEGDDEQLLFPTLTMSRTGAMHRAWLARAKFDAWWDATDKKYAKQGFLVDPILGLRCDFLDGSDDPQIGNKLVNFECQSGGAAIVHLATKRFVQNMPKAWRERSKADPRLRRVMLVQQGHDALVAESDDDLDEKVGKFMEECFTFGPNDFGLGVKFFGEMKVGTNWKEV